ncbi:hypothetical protein [Oryzifoliimicrobium ureilyticus]|uniref:hypothetical protein n=1 Tax=Oryzifoliimicrobium ureilyticus TaxID=3113724 RepID=UPI003076184F
MVRAVDIAVAAHLQSRQGVIPRNFVWITAKSLTDGSSESIGFWNGVDTVDVTVVSGQTGALETRTYHAWGSWLSIENIQRSPEVAIRTIKMKLSQVSPEVQQAFRGYDTRLAPVEIHRGFLDLDTRKHIGTPVLRFMGWINKAPITTPAVGEQGGVEVSVVSHARMLTRINPAKRSDESQKRRSGDRFRRYAGTAAEWEFWWGEQKSTMASTVKSLPAQVFKRGN